MTERHVLLEASVAAGVAAWDSYVKEAVRAFLQASYPPSGYGAQAAHELLVGLANDRLNRFNTPNSDNVRMLLMSVTGYDPWPDWVYARRNLNSLQMRGRLDEILKVRHSFAHGHAMPSFSWNTNRLGAVQLNTKAVSDVLAIIHILTITTDQGLTRRLRSVHGVVGQW